MWQGEEPTRHVNHCSMSLPGNQIFFCHFQVDVPMFFWCSCDSEAAKGLLYGKHKTVTSKKSEGTNSFLTLLSSWFWTSRIYLPHPATTGAVFQPLCVDSRGLVRGMQQRFQRTSSLSRYLRFIINLISFPWTFPKLLHQILSIFPKLLHDSHHAQITKIRQYKHIYSLTHSDHDISIHGLQTKSPIKISPGSQHLSTSQAVSQAVTL